MRAALDDKAQAQVEFLTVGGLRIPFTLKPNGVASQYIAAPTDDALAVCIGDAQSLARRCEPLVRWMANHGLPPGVTFPKSDLRLAGVDLKVPAGCQMQGPERIVCGAVGLDFRESSDPHADPLAIIEQIYAKAGFEVQSSLPHECSLAGLPSKGKVLNVLVNGTPLVVTLCAAKHGANTSTAACIGANPLKQVYPPPCDQVFVPVPAKR